jgi:prophage DNA circulation protein
MTKTKDRVSDVKPYVERALKDDEFRDNLKSAFVAAKDVYEELMGPRGVSGKAVRVASDKELRETLRSAIEDLRSAADRVQNGPSHKGRNLVLVTGIALGILLFNPMTGADTRKWLKGSVLGEDDEFGYQGNSNS